MEKKYILILSFICVGLLIMLSFQIDGLFNKYNEKEKYSGSCYYAMEQCKNENVKSCYFVNEICGVEGS